MTILYLKEKKNLLIVIIVRLTPIYLNDIQKVKEKNLKSKN